MPETDNHLGALFLSTEPNPANPSTEVKILVADDSPVYRMLVERSFSEAKYKILLASDGREALKLFSEHEPSLVITDWTMPDISGIELCRRIRSDFQHLYPYVILLTGNSNKVEIIEGLAAGADDYLTKPFHSGELLARVSVGLRIVDLHRQVQAKNRELEKLALTDPLTGLPNRRAIDLWAVRQLKAAARHGFPLWVAILDLDHFKRVNDEFGHDAGDKVLRSVADILKANTRQSNICGRLGGEEFLVIITHANEHEARIVFERIRCEFEQRRFTFGEQTIGVTASFGVAGLKAEEGCDLNKLISHADLALYSAKKNGRNRIEFEVPIRQS